MRVWIRNASFLFLIGTALGNIGLLRGELYRVLALVTFVVFLSTFSAVYNHFNIQRHLVSRKTMRQFRSEAFEGWADVTMAA